MSGAPIGNKNAVKNRPWSDAINRALLAEDGKKLRELADMLISKALEGDVPALKEVGDRVEGRPAQAILLGEDAENPLLGAVTRLKMAQPSE